MGKYLPQALGATALVVAGPVVAVWALRSWQVVGSTAVAIVIGVVLSLALSFAGSSYWANRESSRDVLFSELMIWGWLRRWRAEHKLTAALERLAELTAARAAREGTPQLAMLTELAEALEAGDPYTRNHSRRVARYASMIAERLGLASEEVDRIRTAAMLHDVGKVRTPIEVLHKPGRLTDEEYAIIKAHPVDGAQLVEALADPRLTAIVRHHHERLDGRGYPDGLRGEEIPLGARIIAVADTFDAITSARSYRPASSHRKALDILIAEAGTQLDADAVRAFRACYIGRRPFALWMTMLAFPQRLSTALGNGTTASAASLPKIVMAASTVTIVGGAAASARPLVIDPAGPQVKVAATAATVASATPTPPSPGPPTAATGAPSIPAALGAKLRSPAARTGEQETLRRPGNLSRRFPVSPHAAHRAAPRSSRTRSARVRTASSSARSTSAASTSVPRTPVSTVAQPPAPSRTTPTATRPAGSGSGGHGQGGGQGHGNTTTKPTAPTKTTTPGSTPSGDGNPTGSGSAGVAGNGNASTSPGGSGTANAGGNGTGAGVTGTTASGNGNGNGTGTGATGTAGSENGAATGTIGTSDGTSGTTGSGHPRLTT